MSSYDKVVKLACKPKAAPPKAKYLDTIIAATWSEDGAVHDVCKALSPRFREPNAVVVFKALIVLHTMIRNGATDNVLSYLSSSEVLRLNNVSAGTWEGYAAPENLQNYAVYLESRIRAYKDLKHDAVRVQAESNRDMRTSQSIEEDGYRVKKGVGKHNQSAPPTRSKTIMGRKLRVMTVEKGLLRETKAVHRMIDALVECRFYLDDLEDELTITALRMLVKDLLILFQAGNEGVINVLEHYFEMSHVDAREALAIYRHFCKQTEKVVEYLGVAKKLQNLLNVPIPNLKHAPVSLAGALQEYLDDVNFEQNRIEYKTNKEAAERSSRKGTSATKRPTDKPSSILKNSSPEPLPTNAAAIASSGSSGNAVTDFFTAIEEEQPTMFNPQTNSPSSAYFQQQGAVNPFMQMQMTGQPFIQQPQMQMQIQTTGFPVGGPAPNPFGLQAPSHLRPQPVGQSGGHRPFTSYLPQSVTSPTGGQSLLQPQMTGANPFRQSMMLPQTTGMTMFGVGGGQALHPQNTATPFMNGAQNHMSQGQPAYVGTVFGGQPGMNTNMNGISLIPTSSFTNTGPQQSPRDIPTRPASTPLTSVPPNTNSSASPPVAQPVKTHQTGTRNPFGRVATPPPPPVPKQPTLMELAMGMGSMNVNGNMPSQTPQQHVATNQTGFAFTNSSLNPGATDISSVASSFAFNRTADSASSTNLASFDASNSQNTSDTTSSMFSDSLWSSSVSSQRTGATNTTATSSAPSISFTPVLKPQTTGFAGLKPFKPSSSFGASLMDSLPPIPGSAPATPSLNGTDSNATNAQSANGFNFSTSSPSTMSPSSSFQSNASAGSSVGAQPTGFGNLNAQPTGMPNFSSIGSTTGMGLRPQMTGGINGANPFRASMVNGNTTGGMSMFAGNGAGMGQSSLGSNMLGIQNPSGAFGSNFGANHGQQQQQQQQQQVTASLI